MNPGGPSGDNKVRHLARGDTRMPRFLRFLSSIPTAVRPGPLPHLMAAGVAFATILSGPAVAAENKVVKSFTSGDAPNSVGVIDGREDAPFDGPQAIYAAEDGSLYLLDQINGRVLRFD